MEATAILPLAVLSALVSVAVAHDLLFRRIPNSLVLAGMVLGILFHGFSHSGAGVFSPDAGGIGAGSALVGGLIGLALFLPLYAWRTRGAGDVKLLAMLGVWFGPTSIAWAALWTLLAGGVLALVVALWSGVLRQVLLNLYLMLANTMLHVHGGHRIAADPQARSTTGRLPYAVAIACGALVEVLRLRMRAAT